MATAYVRTQAPDPVDLAFFDDLYHQYHHAVYSNIRKIIRQPQAAEDILQEVFLALWENRHHLDASKVAGWLFVTSYNKSVKQLKRLTKERAMPLEEEEFQDGLLQEEPPIEELHRFRVSMIEDAVSHLPERKKQVFRLCRYEGKSCDEVAKIMEISPSSVKDYLKQSNRFIREYIFTHYSEVSLTLAPLVILYFTS